MNQSCTCTRLIRFIVLVYSLGIVVMLALTITQVDLCWTGLALHFYFGSIAHVLLFITYCGKEMAPFFCNASQLWLFWRIIGCLAVAW